MARSIRERPMMSMESRLGRHHGGAERQETPEQHAARLVAEELKRRKKGDRAKAQIAQRLRQETTVTWDWIARGLVLSVGRWGPGES